MGLRFNVDETTPAHEISVAYETSDGDRGFCSVGLLILMAARAAGGNWMPEYRPTLRQFKGRTC